MALLAPGAGVRGVLAGISGKSRQHEDGMVITILSTRPPPSHATATTHRHHIPADVAHHHLGTGTGTPPRYFRRHHAGATGLCRATPACSYATTVAA